MLFPHRHRSPLRGEAGSGVVRLVLQSRRVVHAHQLPLDGPAEALSEALWASAAVARGRGAGGDDALGAAGLAAAAGMDGVGARDMEPRLRDGKTVMLSRFVALSVSLTQKASLFQGCTTGTFPLAWG